MFYEIEMLSEYVDSIISAASEIENREAVTVVIDFNTQETLERISPEYYDNDHKLGNEISRLRECGFKVILNIITDSVPFYNIAQHRRKINEDWCEVVDFVIWGETDSMFPSELFDVIERISDMSSQNEIHRYVINFGDRKNWDKSWDIVTHPKFRDVEYVDEKSWFLYDEASSKSYMSRARMDEINAETTEYDIRVFREPKFDGSCLVISSQLILSGVNIPKAVTHCAEDTSFGTMAKLICGDSFVQFCVVNILRVHNRRHPKKRMYIIGENNPHGFVGDEKGKWWGILEGTSKYNASILGNNQSKFISMSYILNEINELR